MTVKILEKYIESENIASMLDKDELGKIGTKVVSGFEMDANNKNRKDYEVKMKDAIKLANQTEEVKNYPWNKASNVKYPLVTNAALQFSARAFPLIMNNGDIVSVKVMGGEDDLVTDEETGEFKTNDPENDGGFVTKKSEGDRRGSRVSKYMNWQLTAGCDNQFETDMDAMLLRMSILGVYIKKVYYDVDKGMPVSSLINPLDFYIEDGKEHIKDAYRVSQRLNIPYRTVIERQNYGLFLKEEEGAELNLVKESEATYESTDEVSDVLDGGSYDLEDFIEQHTYLDLDDDGYEEPYIVTVHAKTSKVVRIVARYGIDDITAESNEKNKDIPAEGKVLKIKEQSYFIKYPFIPSISGSFYSLGFADLLKALNDAINTSINQTIDATHLSIVGGGFIGGGIKIKGGTSKLTPGEYKFVNNGGASLRENIMPMPHPAVSPVMLQMIDLLILSGKEVAAIKDILTGEGSANMPATTTIALIEQGLSMFKAIYKRIHLSLTKELQLLYNLNAKYLDLDLYKNIVNDNEASAEDFNVEDYDIIPVSDPYRATSQEKMGAVNLLMQFLDDPLVNREEVLRRVFDGANIEDIDKLIVKPEPQEPNPADILTLEGMKANIELVRAQINKLSTGTELDINEQMRKGAETSSDIELNTVKTQSEVVKRTSESVKNIAEAESKEEGKQNETYINELKQATEKTIDGEIERTGLSDVEERT